MRSIYSIILFFAFLFILIYAYAHIIIRLTQCFITVGGGDYKELVKLLLKGLE